MLPPVFALLKQSAAVRAIVQTGSESPRIYRHGIAPQDIERPYVTWFMVSGVPENTLSELPLADRCTVQIDCWHQTDRGVEDLAVAVRDALEPSAVMTGAPVDLRETETKLFRMTLQFDFFIDH